MKKTPGQLAYELDVAAMPTYDGGIPRKTWDQLAGPAKQSWERNPTPRKYIAMPNAGVPINHLADILCAALEGGIGYWSCADDIKRVDVPDDAVGWRYESARLFDAEDTDKDLGILTLDTIALGMQRIIRGETKVRTDIRQRVAMMVLDPENTDYDADDADAIVQAGMFNEIVYG